MRDKQNINVTQQRLYAGVGVLLFLLSLAAPRLAMAQADGVLCQVITASEARERTKANPEERDTENRVLILANMAYEQACLVSQSSVSFEEREETKASRLSEDSEIVEPAHDWPATALRAPPRFDLAQAEQPLLMCVYDASYEGQFASRLSIPRAPPARL